MVYNSCINQWCNMKVSMPSVFSNCVEKFVPTNLRKPLQVAMGAVAAIGLGYTAYRVCSKAIEAKLNDYLVNRMAILVTPNQDLGEEALKDKARARLIRDEIVRSFSSIESIRQIAQDRGLSAKHQAYLEETIVPYAKTADIVLQGWDTLMKGLNQKPNPHETTAELSRVDTYILEKLKNAIVLRTKPKEELTDEDKAAIARADAWRAKLAVLFLKRIADVELSPWKNVSAVQRYGLTTTLQLLLPYLSSKTTS